MHSFRIRTNASPVASRSLIPAHKSCVVKFLLYVYTCGLNFAEFLCIWMEGRCTSATFKNCMHLRRLKISVQFPHIEDTHLRAIGLQPSLSDCIAQFSLLSVFNTDRVHPFTENPDGVSAVWELAHQLPWGALRGLQTPPAAPRGLIYRANLPLGCAQTVFFWMSVCVCALAHVRLTQRSISEGASYHMAALMIFMTHSLMHWQTLTSGAPRSPIFPSSRPEDRQHSHVYRCGSRRGCLKRGATGFGILWVLPQAISTEKGMPLDNFFLTS